MNMTSNRVHPRRALPAAWWLASTAVVVLAGCATAQRALLPTGMQPMVTQSSIPAPVAERDAPIRPDGAAGDVRTVDPKGPSTAIVPTPALPPAEAKPAAARAAPAPFPDDEPRDIALNFDQTPLVTFVQVVFGTILKSNVIVDPAVAQRQDLVTLRTGKPQNRSEVLQTARLLLKTYGVTVLDLGGAFRVVPDSAATSVTPEIRRGRALPDVPQPMRPVFHFFELQAVRVQDMAQWLRAIFGTRVQFTEDVARNALLLSGQADTVAAVGEAIQTLDQPMLRGRSSVRIEPVYWSAQDLAARLADILTAQGYSVGTVASGNQPVILMPVAAINSVIAFSVSPTILDYVTRWVKELDQPSTARGAGSGFFTYAARNTDARDLAKTLQELLAGAPPATAPAPGQPVTAARPAPRVVVNPGTNTLILQGAPDSYTQFISLLQELDRPARTALIEVTVAEVTLTDKESLGVEWQLADATVNGRTVQAGTLGGLGIGSDGLLVRVLSSAGQTRAVINALASANRARVLSSPRLMARNGEPAIIQVGQEVPVITSQQTTATPVTPGAILQTIQYRQTGVILRVRPIIHSGGRIELDIAQEVSAASETRTGVNNSPTISTRKVETKLALADGATVLLAGLISQNESRGDTGIPVLKDIPLIGQLFRVNTDSKDRTELIVLITPYLINNDFEARVITDAFRSQLGPWARPSGEAAARLPALVEPLVPAPVRPEPAREAPTAVPPAQPEQVRPAPQPSNAPGAAVPDRPIEDPKVVDEIRRALEKPPQPARK